MWARNPTRSVLRILFVFALATAAPRASSDPLTGDCGGPATRVHTIQGAGRSSPLLGRGIESEDVVVEAVIVGWFPGFPGGLGGFFVQEEDGDTDGDPRTSEGLFVFDTTPRSGLALGDLVRVRGRVSEFFGLTELSQVSDVVVCPPRGIASPVPIELPLEDEALWERWEGMRVEFDQRLVLTGQHSLGRFGEIELALDARLEQATQHREPGESALEWIEWNARRRLLLDDGSDSLNPEPVPYLDRTGGGTLRLGDTLAHLEGVVDFAFGRFRIQPIEAVAFEANASRPLRPPEVAGTLRVVNWNVENHMNGDGRGGGFPTRGPRNAEELERQRAKLTETLAALDPDIATLVEIENDGTGPDSALAQLVAALNDLSVGSPYEAIHPDATRLGSHAIAVGMFYRRDAVVPVGPPAILDAQAHPDFDDTRNRPSLAQTFQTHATGESLTIVVNHFKSKGSSCDSVGDPDRGDGQGQCNATRTRAARSAVEWLANDPERDARVPVLLTGDLNAYPREDPVRAIEAAGYVDLIGRFADPAAHTFVFDGEAGRLDYMLGRADLLPFVGGAGVWNTNSDESDVFDYHLENPPDRYLPDAFRASDHDPILVGLFPDADGDALTDARDRCPHSVLSPTLILGECDSGVPNRLDDAGCSLSDDLLAAGGFDESSVKRGRWASEVNRWLTLQIDEGTLEPRHRGAILACVARAG
jgi:predicted extracellular nuclease